MSSLIPQSRLIRLLCIVIFGLSTTVSFAGEHSSAFDLEATQPQPLIGEKAASESGFDYFLVESWDGQRVWSNKSGNWGMEISSPSVDYYNIWGLDGQDIYIAYGNEHGVNHFHDGSWSPEIFPGAPSLIFDVWGFDRNSVFALGYNSSGSSTHLFHYDGEGWTEVAIKTSLLAGRGLWGSSAQNMFMIGLDGDIGFYDGENISAMDSGVDSNLNAVWGTGSQNVYAVGNDGVVLHYDGVSWEPAAIPASSANYYDVWGSGPDDIFVVGEGSVLQFDGTTWTQVLQTPEVSIRGVFGSSASDVYVVGGNGLIVHFDGESWVDESPETSGTFFSIWGGLRRDGDQNWSSEFNDMGEGGQGFNGSTRSLLNWDGGMVIAGEFVTAGVDSIKGIGFWDGVDMNPLYASSGPNSSVFDMIVYDGELIAGGSFTSIDGMDIKCVAAWNGSQWRQLGAGVGDPVIWGVSRLIIWDGKLVTIGDPGCTAAWDGSTWTMLDGFEGRLFDAIEYQGDLLAGGMITAPGSGVLILVEGQWELYPGSEIDGSYIIDFERIGTSLLVGGFFSSFGELTDVGNLVQLDGDVWSNYSGGTDGEVYKIKPYLDGILVGGYFNIVGEDLPVSHIAYYDGENWHAMGSGLDSWAWDLLVDGDQAFAAGGFRTAGNHPAYHVANWHEVELAIPGAPSSGPAEAGQDHTVSIQIDGDPGSYPVNLYYRLRDNDPYQVAIMTPSASKSGAFEATVPGEFLGELGFQYFVSSGSSTDPVFFPASAPAEPSFTSVVMVDESLGLPLADQYVMMGIPFVPDQSIGDILTDAFGPYDPSKWRFGRWEPLTLTYGEFPNVPAQAPGRGYWLIQKTPTDLPANGVTTSTVGSVVVALEPGWNQIATPYNFEIPWAAVTRGPNVENRLIARSGGGYVDVTQMNPWQGYWVRNTGLNATTITIPPTVLIGPVDKGQKSEESGQPDPTLDTALWSITLGVETEDRFDRQNVAAISPEAAAGIDVLDYFEPPALPGDVSLFFELSENEITHSLSRDMRAPFTKGVAWDLVLRRQGGGLVDLDIEGSSEVPGDHGVFLLTQDGRVDLRQSEQVAVLVGSGGETRMRLVVGEPEFVQEQEQGLPRPFALRTAYPNPFNPKTTLGFTLPKDSHVNLDIFDMRGRLVRNLVDDSFEAGLHEVPWNGLDDTGRSVSAGVYFSRMQTEQFQQTRKMTLVR